MTEPVTSWRWVRADVAYAIHDRQLAEHSGAAGVLDAGRIEAALARPGNLTHYGTPDAADLAAAYAFGLARNHGFADGNKRVAWVTARLFLADNGYAIEFEAIDAIRAIEDVARGALSEGDLAAWFRQRLKGRAQIS